jgi:hypothetical protein
MDADGGIVAVGWRIRPRAAVRSRLLGLSLFALCNLHHEYGAFSKYVSQII